MEGGGVIFRFGAIYCDNLHYNFKHNLLIKNKLFKIREAFAFAIFLSARWWKSGAQWWRVQNSGPDNPNFC